MITLCKGNGWHCILQTFGQDGVTFSSMTNWVKRDIYDDIKEAVKAISWYLKEHFNPEKEYTISVFDALGRSVGSHKRVRERETVALGEAPGIYIIAVMTSDKVIGTVRVMCL
jgi:hypothetical protein